MIVTKINSCKILFRLMVVFLGSLAMAACFSPQLKAGAAGVHIFFQNDNISKCKTVSQIDTGSNRVKDFQDAQIILRNTAFDMGANAIRIARFQPGQIAQADALRCPASLIQQVTNDPYYTNQSNNASNTNSNTNSSNDSTNNSNTTTSNIQGELVSRQGRTWQRCSYGQYMANGNCQGDSVQTDWRSSVQYCNKLQLANRSWRMPTQQELQSLLDKGSRAGALIDLKAFPNTGDGLYWSADYYEPNNSNVVWAVDFKTGNTFAYGLKNKAYVRCISD